MEQLSIFDDVLEEFKITKPIKLIECFAGYGSQALALKYLGLEFTHHRICEWAVKSIQAYKDIHFTNDNTDYSQLCTKEQLVDYLFKKGISSNYSDPMTYEQIKRLSENQLRTIYNNIVTTHNLVNITQVTGKDLDIYDIDSFTYLLTYSFPCQDLSLAGKGKGMKRDSGTRSGLLWEIERILKELKQLGTLPQILLMENVPQVIGTKNIKDFQDWELFLESLGYSNYVELLNAKDYGIPQNRERAFMISILGDYKYEFPKPIELKLRLKDMLEENVDESYFLSDKQLFQISNWNSYQNPLENVLGTDTICPTITTRIAESQDEGINASMIVVCENSKNCINIREKTKQGYAIAHEGDGVYINRPHQKRGCVQEGMIQTLKTSPDVGVVIKKDTPNYIEWEQQGRLDIDCRAWKENAIAPTTTTTPHNKVLLNNLRIRKLTPRECGRLMGVKDEDIDKLTLSKSAQYHCFGDSIVVDVLMAIFKQLL